MIGEHRRQCRVIAPDSERASHRPVSGAVFAALAGVLLATVGLYGQTATLRGRVVDPAGAPVAGVVVALHRVSEGGGAEVGRAVSGPDGLFAVEYEARDGEGVYFAATRYEGDLYMGAPFRAPDEAGPDYVIQVGTNPVGSATAVGAGAGAPVAPPASGAPPWAVAGLIGLAAVLAVGFPLVRGRSGPQAVRALLLELAELEESRKELAGGEARDEARRLAIRSRLKKLTASTAPHAADHD